MLQTWSLYGLLLRFTPYLRRYARLLALAASLALVVPVVGAGVLWLVRSIVDDVFVEANLSPLPMLALAYLVATLGKALLEYAETRIEASIGEGLSNDIRVDLYRHLVSLPPGALGRRGTGDQLARLSGDVERAQSLIYSVPFQMLGDLAAILLFGAFLLVLDWQMTLVALLIVPAFVIASRHFASLLRRSSRIARVHVARWFDHAEERLAALPLIHSFQTQEREAEAFAVRSDCSRKAELRTAKMEALYALAIDVSTAIAGIIVIAFGAYQIRHGSLTVGTLVAFLGAVGALYAPIRGLAGASARLQKAAAGAERIAELFGVSTHVGEAPDAQPLVSVRGAIEFRNVSFRYPGGEWVLHDVSFRIEPGESVAIVGPSGCGKSTLVGLLLRLNDPSSGAVLIDGIDIRGIDRKSLSRAVAAAFQEPFILRGSVADNLRYGQPAAGAAVAIEAARKAGVDPFVEAMKAGYATDVGPRGSRLSGGQRQRLAMARALLRNAPILVLDEATAGIDSETEALIQDALDGHPAARTTLIVGHRLSSLRPADRVLVLEHGRIVESGTPDRLLAAPSRYRDLFAPQLQMRRVCA